MIEHALRTPYGAYGARVTRVDEVICIAAFMQAIVAKLLLLGQKNRTWRHYRHALITENKWRAVRYGLDGSLIDFGKKEEIPVRFLIRELLEFVDDVVDELGSRKEVEYVQRVLQNGTSADRHGCLQSNSQARRWSSANRRIAATSCAWKYSSGCT